jgi:ATP-grasp domain
MSLLILTRRPRLAEMASWLGGHAGSCVVLTTGSAVPDSAAGAFGHVEYVADYNTPDLGGTIVDLARRFGVRRIGSLNEVDVMRAAAARRVLGLPGQDMSSAVAFRDKYVMKSLAHAAGVPVARMRLVRSPRRGRESVEALGYPLVVKPVAGGGSVDVRLVASPQDWDAVAAAEPLLAEEWVEESDFFVVDGLMRDGGISVHAVLHMRTGNLCYMTDGLPVVGYSLPEGSADAGRVTDFARRVLEALPSTPDETAFHMEIIQNAEGDLLLCEVASRAGGMGHAPTFAAVTGVDLNAASLLGQLGLDRPERPAHRLREAAFAGFPKRNGRLVRHPESLSGESITMYTSSVKAGDTVEASKWAGDDAASMRLQAPVGTDLAAIVADVLAEYAAGTQWA